MKVFLLILKGSKVYGRPIPENSARTTVNFAPQGPQKCTTSPAGLQKVAKGPAGPEKNEECAPQGPKNEK